MPKATERYKKIKEDILKEEQKVNEVVEYSHFIYDCYKSEEGKYVIVKLSFNSNGDVSLELTGKEFDNPAKADYNIQELNGNERVRRLRKGNL
jgi:hypothetical protein